MTIPFICVLLAWLLIYAPKIPLTIAMARQPEGFDNKLPRAQQDRLTGMGARARAAHLNSFEAFAPFAAAVLIAHVGGGDPRRASLLAIAFVASRVLYIAAYLADLDKLRSTLWGIGMLIVAALMLLPTM